MLCHEHSFEFISINCAKDLGGKSTFNALLFPKNGADRDELGGWGGGTTLEELPCVQSWEEGFLQGMGELFPSALSSLLMSCPLQGAER